MEKPNRAPLTADDIHGAEKVDPETVAGTPMYRPHGQRIFEAHQLHEMAGVMLSTGKYKLPSGEIVAVV